MKKFLLIPILVFSLSACGAQPVSNNADDDSDQDAAKSSSEAKTDGDAMTSAEKTDGDAMTSDDSSEKTDGDAMTKDEVKTTFSDTIKVTSFEADETLVSPAAISGEADVESGVVIVELRKTDHSVTSDSVEAIVVDGKFSISKFWFEFRNTDAGYVAVYDKDNMENLVEIPVKFQTVK